MSCALLYINCFYSFYLLFSFLIECFIQIFYSLRIMKIDILHSVFLLLFIIYCIPVNNYYFSQFQLFIFPSSPNTNSLIKFTPFSLNYISGIFGLQILLHYEYDYRGRLKAIRDDQGQLKELYEYNYQTSGLNP